MSPNAAAKSDNPAPGIDHYQRHRPEQTLLYRMAESAALLLDEVFPEPSLPAPDRRGSLNQPLVNVAQGIDTSYTHDQLILCIRCQAAAGKS